MWEPSLTAVWHKWDPPVIRNHMPNQFCTTNNIEGQTKAILKTHIEKPISMTLPFKAFDHH